MKFFNTEGLPDFKAGAARHCITPPVGVSLYGYFHDRIGTYVKDDLFCHAMVIEGDGGKIVLISLDLGCIPQPQVLQAKKLIEEKTSISGSNVLICATHTHTGPVMSPDSFLKCDTEWLAALPPRQNRRHRSRREQQAATRPARSRHNHRGRSRLQSSFTASRWFGTFYA